MPFSATTTRHGDRHTAAPLVAAGLSVAAACLCADATAVAPGPWLCTIDAASRVPAAHGHASFEAPASFEFRAFRSRVTPAELEQPLRTTESIVSEEMALTSASVDAPLFASALTAMRSSDGRLYTQNASVIAFGDDGRFIAYGPVATNVLDGIVVYVGACRKREK